MSSDLSSTFEYVFPAISGIQAGRQFYITMCPVHLIPKIFLFDEDELLPHLRAQRTLNKTRIPEMARYMLNNRDSYTFSALTASVDGDVVFHRTDGHANLGTLHIPMSARFIINDGQHRRAAIEEALNQSPEIGNETIGVVLYHDRGLERSQQMFADLNKHAIRPSTSLSILYDHRDLNGSISKLLAFESPVFKGLVEMEKTTLSQRSRKLFTLSAIYSANRALFKDLNPESHAEDQLYEIADKFWQAVGKRIKEWHLVQSNDISASQIRQDYIHSHGITLQALGVVGNALVRSETPFEKGLSGLSKIDWHRSNREMWEGRAMHNGKLSKASTSVTLTANAIKRELGQKLTPEEQLAEKEIGKR